MSLPKNNFNPPFNIIRASHILLLVKDLGKSENFYKDILGLHPEEKTATTLTFRGMEERNTSLILQQSDNPSCGFIGFRVGAEEDLDKAKAWFQSKGLHAEFSEQPGRGKVLQTIDNIGFKMEFSASLERKPIITQKYQLYKGVHPLRIDHFNCFSPDVQGSTEFYTEMGFRVTEYTETDPPDAKLWATWMHRKGGVHDIAFTNGVGPRLHHFAYWVPTPLHIIHLCDVMSTTGYLKNLERGPGRHGISNAFFLYIRDPDNNRVEIYCSDYLTVDPDLEPIKWSMSDTQRQTLWGMPAPRSWFEEGSTFPNTPTIEPNLQAKPIIAH